MKIVKLILGVLFFSTILLAKSYEGTIERNVLRDGSDNCFEFNLEIKYKVWTLMGEPVIDAVAKYEIGDFVDVDGHSYETSKFPKEVINKLRLYGLDIRTHFITSTNYEKLFVDLDIGVLSSAGNWGFNAPESPSWSKWIEVGNFGDYLDKDEAKEAYRGFKALGFKPFGDSDYSALTKISNIRYDVSALREYLNEQALNKGYITKDEYKTSKSKSREERQTADEYIDNKKYEIEDKTLPTSPNISGKWYRERDDRLLIIEDNYAHYPNGSKGIWEGHDTKYKSIEYIDDNKWKCKEEYYEDDDSDFHWRNAFIYMIDENTLRVDGYHDETTIWKR